MQPKLAKLPDRADEFLEINRFGDERIGAQVIGLVYVGTVKGRRQHNDGQTVPFRVVPHPGEDFEAVNERHFQVQQQEGWNGIELAICVSAFAFKVLQGLRAVAHDFQRVFEAGLFESPVNERHIVRIILRK